jgi:hypothetical protein
MKARRSAARVSGSSRAAKWPPGVIRVQPSGQRDIALPTVT